MDLLTTIAICSMFHSNATVNAIIQTGSKNQALAITTLSANNDLLAPLKNFKTLAQASDYAKQQLAQGNHVEIGMMQIPSGWLDPLSKRGISLDDLLMPCKNVVVGSDLLTQADAYCATQTSTPAAQARCALSVYKTGSVSKGLSYAEKILQYAAIHPVKISSKETHAADESELDYDTELALPIPDFAINSDKEGASNHDQNNS